MFATLMRDICLYASFFSDFYYRYSMQKKYKELLDLLYSGARLLLQKKQV